MASLLVWSTAIRFRLKCTLISLQVKMEKYRGQLKLCIDASDNDNKNWRVQFEMYINLKCTSITLKAIVGMIEFYLKVHRLVSLRDRVEKFKFNLRCTMPLFTNES